jgi:hypothetical protein
MADKPPEDDDKLPARETDERFERAVRNALATPPKPHKKPAKSREPR